MPKKSMNLLKLFQHRASGGSVTVGSAYSAVGASVLQNSHNSQNGNSH